MAAMGQWGYPCQLLSQTCILSPALWAALLSPTCVLLVASSLCPFLLRQASFHASHTSSFSTQNRTSTARPCGERRHERQPFIAS